MNYPRANLQAAHRPAGRPPWRARLRPWLEEAPPSTPTIHICLPYEGAPRVLLTEGTTEADRDRLLAWLKGNPRLLELVGEAIELQAEAEALP